MPERDPNLDRYSLQGKHPAVILRLSARSDTFTENGFRVGLAANIYYDVVVNLPNGGIRVYEEVQPDHRRPSYQSLIIPAEPDDEATCCIRGYRTTFMIHEALYSIDCATP